MFAMLGALMASLFLAPTLCIFFLKGKIKKDKDIPVVHFFQRLYEPLLRGALKKRKLALMISVVMLVI